MPDANTASGSTHALPSSGRAYDDRAESLASRILDALKAGAANLWYAARFLLFIVYVLLAIVSIWLLLLGALAGALRFVVRAVMIVFLWLSGGISPPHGARPRSLAESIERDLRYFWRSRVVAYRRFSRGTAEHIVGAGRAARTFWHWSIGRQAFALFVAAIAIGLPLMYVVPRPHYVQITDDNAIQYEVHNQKVIYLVHAVDLFKPSRTREYINEDAIHLGKFNSQGIKAQLIPGRYYKLWVVGIRWWKFPRLFPNIIKAQEVDAEGNVLQNPSMHLPSTTIPVPAGG